MSKVCRKFQEAVIGSAGTGQWARHSALGPWGVRILNIATKFSSELRTSDQVLLMWPMRGFHDGTPELCQELSASEAWKQSSPLSSSFVFCVDFSKEPVQHKRLNSKCQKTRRGEMGNQSFTFHVSLNLVWLWLDWGIEAEGAGVAVMRLGEGGAPSKPIRAYYIKLMNQICLIL